MESNNSGLASKPFGMGDRRRRTPGKAGDGLAGFYVMVNGQVESAEFRGMDNMFCRYTFSYGPDWRIMQGVDHGFSQVAQKGASADASIVWNFPLDITFKTTNAHGWPRLVMSIYSQDMFGRYVIRGYGSVLVPTVPGRYVRYVRTFAPVSSTYLQAALGWLTGHLPEFYDSRFVASNEGREVVRVASTGVVRVQLNVMSRGMHSHGYATGGPPDAPDLDAEAAFVAGLPMSSAVSHSIAPTTSRYQDIVHAAMQSTQTKGASGMVAGQGSVAEKKPPLHGSSDSAVSSSSSGAAAGGAGVGRSASASLSRVQEVESVGPGGAGAASGSGGDRGRDRDRSRDREREGGTGGEGLGQADRSSSRRRLAAVDEEEEREREGRANKGKARER